ncbi:hypothetical protein I0C86_01570 [Plantactinospora sp. S1510]|uniref:DUF3618 domain-containing protein n=1 Tax=Plantactinospora alkalitolerans TaxID=2789879 RepID=A0ABS0GND1_9ACTN|nr:hypothetical protein [Plantactinospora alkalitolerans]MBF9127690.1 hypothetical protein [Plantactinospora alkalitolerans]
MTVSVGEVVAQLLAVRRKLDAAAVTALRAQADADQAEAHFTEVARGTSHNDIGEAITASHTASEKAARYARLLAKANGSLTAYINKIAPGSVPTHQAAETAAPSGEQLLNDTVERSNTRRNIDSYLSRMARDAENIQDTAKTSTEAVQQGVNIVRAAPSPPGIQQAGTGTPSAPVPTSRPKIDAPEAAGNIVVVALITGIAIRRFSQTVSDTIARMKKRGHEDRTQRPDSRDGSP